MDDEGMPNDRIFSRLEEARARDFRFSGGRVLGSMCTEPHEIARRAYSMFWEANLGNPGLCPGTGELHEELIGMLGRMLGDPAASGYLVSGGTESNVTALWIARKVTGKKEVIVPRSVHFSFTKAVDLLGMKAIPVDLDETYAADLGQVERAIGPDTAAVVGVAGTTELGVVDPIPQMGELCGDGACLHVDAAFGGFVIPFLKEMGHDIPDFDLSVPNAFSLCVDPHKMGMSTIPAGALLLRNGEHLENIAVDSPYLTTLRHTALQGTRASAAVAASWAVMKYLGREGYREVVKTCWDNTLYLRDRIVEIGLNPVREPVMNILGVSLDNPRDVDLWLQDRGWRVSKGRLPCCLRLIVMPHVTREVIDEFLPVLEQGCKETGEL